MRRRHNGETKAMRTAELIKANVLSIEQAIQVASEGRTGTVVEAKLKKKLKKPAWKVRLVTEHGQVKIYVDGNSGAIIATKVDPIEGSSIPLTHASPGTPSDMSAKERVSFGM